MDDWGAKEIRLDFEYIDFEVANEDWNLYELEDGAKLKTKFVLISVTKRGNEYGFSSQNVVGMAYVPLELRGPPTQPGRRYTIEEIEKAIEKDDMQYKTIKEVWNVYRLKDGATLSVKLTLAKVSRTRLYTDIGEPVYQVQTVPIPKVKLR